MHQAGRVKKYFVLKTFCNGTRETYATEWTLSRVFILGTLFHNKFSKLSELLKDKKCFLEAYVEHSQTSVMEI